MVPGALSASPGPEPLSAAPAAPGAAAISAGPPASGASEGHWSDVLGLLWLVIVLAAYLSPALWDGLSFGPADIGHQLSYLTYVPTHLSHLGVHNHINGDIITQEVPWNSLDWSAVHHGQLPLWNNYSGAGMPLLLNWESSAFALPTLVGYFFPLAASYLVTVAVTLLVAATGAYVAARLLGARPLGAALAGTTFMLSGSFSGWAGWAVSRPMAWAGWILAGALLCWRPGSHRSPGVVVLALAGAFAVYGGFPEALALLAVGMLVLAVVAGAVGKAEGRRVQLGVLARLGAGSAAAAALAAPLWLPGLSVLQGSARSSENGTGGLPFHSLALLFAQGYDGLPTKASLWFGPSNYYESAAYVGIAALVLAVVAMVTSWRRPVVVALGATALVSVIVVYSPAVQPLFTKAALGAVATQRMLPMLAFSLAVLAGLGTEVLQRHWAERRAQMALLAGVAACALVLGYLWLGSRTAGITPAELSIRRHSLVWPAITLSGMAAAGLWAFLASSRRSRRLGDSTPANSAWASRAGRAGCLALLAAQSAYLVWAGIGLNSYSSAPFPVNRAVAGLQRIVGNQLVALDGPNEADVTMWTGTGLYPEVNVGYKVRELAVHDPVMPPGYFRTWPVPGATARAGLGNNVFVPAVTSAAEARHYGASFILASLGRVPTGTHFVTSLGTAPYRLFLYRVPGAAQFSFAPGSQAGVLSATQVGNSTWHLAVRAPRAAALTLRVTYLPGWHVSADGRPLSVREVGGLFAGVTVPAGTRSLVVEYWPAGLTAGFALALAALCALIGAVAAERALGRRTGRRAAPSP